MSRFWKRYSSWKKAEEAWDREAEQAKSTHPLKILKQLPSMPGIAADTAPFLRWKALKYLITQDEKAVFPRHFFKHPVKYSLRLIKSYLRKKSYIRDGDFFLYGINSVTEFENLIADPSKKLIVGFSYCHKPFECPSGRFSSHCMHDLENKTCRQCFIGKMTHALPEEKVIVIIIPTIHHIGEKIFEITEKYPSNEILFLITACELTLEMFGDWGNMAAVRGIGVRLDGRICNTFKAFELSEKGVKPGLTVVHQETQRRMLEIVRTLRDFSET